MGQKYKDSGKAAAEADRIASIAGQNLQEVLLSLRDCLHVLQKTKRMLEVDPDCICVKFNDRESQRERRRELHEAANSIELALEDRVRNWIETSPVDTDGMLEWYNCPEKVGDDKFLWCDRVCVHEKVDMDSALWSDMPETILELVFARLPLHQIFQVRSLSKYWRASIFSPSFQNSFRTTTSHRFAIIAGLEAKRLWSFGISEWKWHALPFQFLPDHCDFPVAGDGGLLCCRRAAPSSNQVKQDLHLYVCNPLTGAWRKLPRPSLVQEFDLVHMITDRRTKQYTITVVDDRQQGKKHSLSTKAVVEVYNSSTNMWTVNNGVFHSKRTNFIHYKKYTRDKFVGIRAYNKVTGFTSVPFVEGYSFQCEKYGFYPFTEFQGQIYMLHVEATIRGIWVLLGSSQKWKKICSIPELPKILKLFIFSLYVSTDVIIISGYSSHHAVDASDEEKKCLWMLDRVQGKWIDVLDTAQGDWVYQMRYEWDSDFSSRFMFELCFDGTP